MFRDLLAVLVVAAVLVVLVPAGLFGWRLADTWSVNETRTLLGGGLAVCGGSVMLMALAVGAGLAARIAGFSRRREPDPPASLPSVSIRQLPAPGGQRMPEWLVVDEPDQAPAALPAPRRKGR